MNSQIVAAVGHATSLTAETSTTTSWNDLIGPIIVPDGKVLRVEDRLIANEVTGTLNVYPDTDSNGLADKDEVTVAVPFQLRHDPSVETNYHVLTPVP